MDQYKAASCVWGYRMFRTPVLSCRVARSLKPCRACAGIVEGKQRGFLCSSATASDRNLLVGCYPGASLHYNNVKLRCCPEAFPDCFLGVPGFWNEMKLPPPGFSIWWPARPRLLGMMTWTKGGEGWTPRETMTLVPV